MKKKNIIYVILVTLVICLPSCKKKETTVIKEILTEWIGKTIEFPTNVQKYPIKEDIEEIDINKPYKILLYVDSLECNSCNLKLYLWEEIIKEANDEMPNEVDFLFYFQPSGDGAELFNLIKRDRFTYPVFIDFDNEIGKLNKFNKMTSQCFLLDKDNTIVLIGNPTFSLKIWDLYKKVIRKEFAKDSKS